MLPVCVCQFALEEDEVWRAALTWTKHQAQIPADSSPAQWDEHQKQAAAKVILTLTLYYGIIVWSHIRKLN